MDIWTEVQKLCDPEDHGRLREIALEDTEYGGRNFLVVLNNLAGKADYPADQWSCSTVWGMGLACLSPISGKMTVLSVASSDG